MADDLRRWLESVRPSTDADHGWAGSAEGRGALDGALGQALRRTRRNPLRRKALWGVPLVTAGGVAAAAVLTANALSPSTPARHLPTVRPAALLLHTVDSCPALLTDLKQHALATVTAAGLPTTRLPQDVLAYSYSLSRFSELDQTLSDTATSGVAGDAVDAGGTSTTNVQEIGVDEPDVVKTDGDRVVTVEGGVLRVLDGTKHSLVGSLDLTQYAGAAQATLLVQGDRALVVLPPDLSASNGVVMASSGSTVVEVDLSGSTPTITSSVRIDGAYVDARQVGSVVRLVAVSAPDLGLQRAGTPAALAANRTAVQAGTLAGWLPTYAVTSAGKTTTRTVGCANVDLPTAYSGGSIVAVYTLDLAHPDADPSPIAVPADGDVVYGTPTSLYLAATPTGGTTTQVHRFDITGSGPPAYLGSATVTGTPVGSYALSAWGAQLRIATSTGSGPAETSAITELDAQTLTVVGSVTGISHGEALTAVRFDGPVAFLSTSLESTFDPLVLVDLRNPAKPGVAGTVSVPGYSAYLHDVGDSRYLAIGGDGAVLQATLFDVQDPRHMTQTGQVLVQDAATYEPQAFDPHAFLWWAPDGLVAVPEEGSKTGTTLVLHLDGQTLTKAGEVADPSGAAPSGVDRTLIVDGALWTVSGNGVQVIDPHTLASTAWVPFR